MFEFHEKPETAVVNLKVRGHHCSDYIYIQTF